MTHRHALIIGLVLGAVSAAPGRARAESHKDTTYSYQQVFPAAVRFLRIDEGLTIVERDAEAGYVLFDLTEEKRTFRGALEVVKLEDSEVRLILRIEDRPSYMEMGILNRLLQKMRTELGPAPDPPAPPPPPAKKKKKPDDDGTPAH